ncbi:MAG: Ig-like domain-containing protein [Clostridia bacterium]|nr:Ig-like domain-containing protein [Clostridia bacterium]
MSYVNSVTVYPSSATITKGKWYYGAYASIASDCPECAEVEWYSNSPSIASVNKTTGYIYGVSTGTTRVYAEATDGSGKKDYITVTVTAPVSVTGISVCPTSLTMNVGDNDYLYETVYPSNATNQTVTWCSSDESVATVNTYSGKVTAKKAGIVTITATTADGGYSDSCEVWVHGKTPVFLIHGRTSNSFYVWGASNRIFVNPMDTSEADNNHYNSSINALSQGNVQYLYTNKNVQDIFGYQTGQTIKVDGTNVANFTMPGVFNGQFDDGKYTSEHPEGGNLAYYLKSNGYKENVNLFVFNYPNEDAVKYSAQKFEAYINNLISYVRTSGSNEMKACFYASKNDYNNNNYKINIVGHSMGGLVARYFIENMYYTNPCEEKIGYDKHVDKLITICTPHWGSGYADVSNETGIKHKLCDHDLDFDSAMYGGNSSTTIDCNLILGDCPDYEYVVTETLNHQNNRSTKYYAIAAIDYPASNKNENDVAFEMPTNYNNITQISNFLAQKGICVENSVNGEIIKVDPKGLGDNMVGFLSQIGWIGDNPNIATPQPEIQMEKIFIDADTNGGNGDNIPIIEALFLLHNKAPHRMPILQKTHEYLED